MVFSLLAEKHILNLNNR